MIDLRYLPEKAVMTLSALLWCSELAEKATAAIGTGDLTEIVAATGMLAATYGLCLHGIWRMWREWV